MDDGVGAEGGIGGGGGGDIVGGDGVAGVLEDGELAGAIARVVAEGEEIPGAV